MSRRRLGSLVLIISLLWPLAALAVSGDADNSFSRDGRVRTFVAKTFDQARAVARQSTGRIVLAGWGVFGAKGSDLVLVRYTKRGKVDKTFGGGDGVTRLHLGGIDTEEWEALHVLPNDKILALGRTDTGSFDDYDLVLARYKPNGRLDRSFSGDGKVVRSFGAGTHEFNDLVVFSNRDIGVVGKKETGSAWDLLAARFTADGSFLGARVEDINNQDVFRAAILQNGKLVGAGLSGGQFIIYRFRGDGTPDPAFGESGGYTRVDFGSFTEGHDLVELPNGKLLVVGTNGLGGGAVAAARFNANGTLDSAWDGDGKLVRDMGPRISGARSVVLQPRDRFVITGTLDDAAGDYDFMALRYEVDGTLDPTFGDGGMKTLDFGANIDRPYDALVQPDGRVVMVGEAGRSTTYHFGAARLKGDVFTNLKVRVRDRIVARGRQFPALPGEEMRITLLRKKGGRYRAVDSAMPTLRGRRDTDEDHFAESGFRSRFDRPAPGKCRVKARWPGGRGYPPSSDVVDFAC